MGLTIKKENEGSLNSLLKAGVACDFARMLVWSVSNEGEIYGGISRDHILLGLTGVTGRLQIFLGPARMAELSAKNRSDPYYFLETPECTDEAIEAEIRSCIPDWLGDTKVRYSRAAHGPVECYALEVTWDQHVVSGYRFHAERFEIPKARPVAERGPFDFSKDLPDSVLHKIIELRAAQNDSAVEIRLPLSEVSSALGFKPRGNYLSDEAKACFGDNERMPTVLYFRHLDGEFLPRIDTLTDRKSLTHVNDPSSMTLDVVADKIRLEGLTAPFKKTLDRYAYRLAGNVFEALEALQNIFGDPSEVFRQKKRQPSRFDSTKWVSALGEFVTNAFAHGEWKSGQDSTRDDKTSWDFAQAVSIVHAGNRVEVLNRKKTEIQLERSREIGTLFPGALNPIHSALKDIGLAMGRNRGLITARSQMDNAGAVAPVFIRDVGHFRVVMPLQNEFPTALLDADHSSIGSTRLPLNFALRLACILGDIDEMTVSGALGISLDSAALALAEGEDSGFLEKTSSMSPSPWRYLHYPLNRPSYRLSNEIAAREFLIGECDVLIPVSVPSIMSPKGIYALSAMGLGHLVKKDFENAIWNIFKREGVFGEKVDEVAQNFINEVQPYRQQYRRQYDR